MLQSFNSVNEMLQNWRPTMPVYCIYDEIYRRTARNFVAGFPGRVLYAVKANSEPTVIKLLHESGIAHFDCASLKEIELIHTHCPGATAYFMVPVRIRGAAREAQQRFGVRHFMVDHMRGLELLVNEIDMTGCVVFARMAVQHMAAMQDFSSKFGAPSADVPEILQAIRQAGAEPALAFNVGSSVTSPEAYRYALQLTRETLQKVPFAIRLVDIGGGYPRAYPDFKVPPLQDYFDAITAAAAELPLADDGEIMAEPGRSLAAPGMSAVVEVLLCKEDRIYINDGMYGVFWELRFKEHSRYPCRVFRGSELLTGETRSYRIYGPTCDGSDVLTGAVDLPVNLTEGDYIEFGLIGAYSLSGRTDFNGFYSDKIVRITSVEPVIYS